MTQRTDLRAVAAGLPLLRLRYRYLRDERRRSRADAEHRYDWYNEGGCRRHACPHHARDKQRPPTGRWFVWLLRTGRRWGKTRTGAEWVRDQVETHGKQFGALVSDTAADVRDVMIEGESGILATSPPWFRPVYEPSKRRVTWPNGAIATTYSAEDPEQLRGGGHDFAWADELAKWRRQRQAWDNLMMTLTYGPDPRCIVTTTPRPTPLIKELSTREDVRLTLGHTLENIDNLSPTARSEIIEQYEGTTLGMQELAGDIIEEAEGALWRRAQIEELRVSPDAVPDLERIVIAIDPSGSSDEGASEQGIVTAGRGLCACVGEPAVHGFLLSDASGRYSPEGWARRAIADYVEFEGDVILGEANFGGEMVEATLRAVDPVVPYKAVHASRGKQVRAQPIAALSEQGRIHHAGVFPALEDQLATWVPGDTSPDRLDAYVWAFTDLFPQKGKRKLTAW